jgi:protein-tyrosine kinase
MSARGDDDGAFNGGSGNRTRTTERGTGEDPSRTALARQSSGQVTENGQSALSTVQLPTGIATREQLDAFRELRTRLLAMGAGINLAHFTTLVVPVTPGSGASFVVRNLALAFALQDRQVAILVDCNLRHPTQHAAFRMRSSDGGLFDFLERPQMGIERLVKPTAIPGLHLIPAGRTPSLPREYFSSQAMQVVMSGLRRGPCFVFLDGPPANGSPDARILSELADFVVLVAGYGHDTSDGITRAAALFDPNKFAGVVFNERG